jgi:predicted DNA-binding transcriptional regulator AlpA
MTNDTPTFLTQPHLRQRYGVSRMTIYRWQKDSKLEFPQPIEINRINYWRLSEVEQWERRQAAKPRLMAE